MLLIKANQKLVDETININDEEPNSMIYIEELVEVNWLTYILKELGTGYSFYLNESEEMQS